MYKDYQSISFCKTFSVIEQTIGDSDNYAYLPLKIQKKTAFNQILIESCSIASPRLINGCSYSHVDAQNKHLLKHEKYKLTITS
ncbi:hypothetical protein T05_2801 [Trichinella murrelli]|uniref:Uncharacterized protein n=1 Tax=Trichinella murrelli TaxID=144512 RepID=A0A0V0UFF9_9BILA|nr:hypothetical protein T05_2801 [Trichinella murrelli]